MENDNSVADRVRELRKRRGMTQEDLADAADVSLPVVRKIEQGGTARMETYHALARALRVRTVWFMATDTPAPVVADRRDSVLADIRAAVNPPSTLAGRMFGAIDGEPDLSLLSRAVDSVAEAYQDDRYDDVAHFAPALVRSAHMHVRTLEGSQHVEARRLRADALQLTGRYLIQVREHDLALIALRDALNDAVEVGDMALAAAAVGQQGWALLRQARFDEVEQLCVTVADEIEPRRATATPDQLSAWGYLLMRASAAAARNNRALEARDLQGAAESAAVRIDGEHRTAGHMRFGRVTTAMNAMQNELITGHPDRALEQAASLPGEIEQATPNTQQRFALDRAKALVQTRDSEKATAVLTGLRRSAPSWLQQQQAARDIMEDVLAERPRMPSEDQRTLADFLGVPV